MIEKKRRDLQEINSSSMADIAFLLLVFFLVTTTISMDKGISLVLPSEGNEMEVNKINIVNILVNESGKVLLDDKPTRLKDIKNIAERRISQNSKVIFSLQTHPRTKYQVYIKVLDQLKSAKAQKISIANPPSF
ncbi:MAG: biopolymer transporter ExbD [Candidatus Marinimicrobia bacterium]|jgi:biopolymer transport protein ExbD|nr:biopolymer transporter ExbD [Candidatus Neomarinimicrobiota bacterium]MBT6870820.1 biopolymer transporter ExbD [Candidatus Neomarinimicrobiota bacterium]MBT7378263.1 biopolymer transporter ExbD [Candidatus Neomarinimicrobiota bacterium]|tara:strand:+ start:12 stop:413 length:402 start_codon:yes stop_codon:yes gene_type:complete